MLDQNLPRGWAMASLGEVTCESVDQSGPDSEQFTYVDISSIDNGKKLITTPKSLSRADAPSRARQCLRQGDVLVSMTRPNLNAVAIVPMSLHGAIGSTGFHVLRANGILPGWIYFAVQTPGFVQAMSSLVQGALYPAVRPRDVRQFIIPLPPLAEQRRIVAEIETQFARLDAAEAALERTNVLAKLYRSSLLAACVLGILDSELNSELPLKSIYDGPWPIPNDWQWVTLEDIACREKGAITDGPFGSNLKTEHYTNAGPRVIRLQNIGDGAFLDASAHISLEHFERLRKHEVLPGDLVIAALGATLPRACIIPDGVGPAIVKADCIRVRVNPAVVIPEYLNFALNADPTKKAVASRVHGVGRPRLNLSEIKDIPVPLPPLHEQEQLVNAVKHHLLAIADLEYAIRQSQEVSELLRQSILQSAFSGRLVPQDPNDEPASVLLERIEAECAIAVPPRRKAGTRRRGAAAAEVQRGLL